MAILVLVSETGHVVLAAVHDCFLPLPILCSLAFGSISAGPGSLPGEVTQTLIPASILAHREYRATRPGSK